MMASKRLAPWWLGSTSHTSILIEVWSDILLSDIQREENTTAITDYTQNNIMRNTTLQNLEEAVKSVVRINDSKMFLSFNKEE